MLCLLLRLLTLGRISHDWTVAWSDDDECRRCSAVRYWPSGTVVR